MRFGICGKAVLGVLLVAAAPCLAIEIVTDQSGPSACEEFSGNRELKILKDPSQFVSYLNQILIDPKSGWDRLVREQTPVVGSVSGKVKFMRLAKGGFRSVEPITRFYQFSEPRLKLGTKIVYIQLCGDGRLGFVLKEDLDKKSAAEEDSETGSMPPSVYPNPIPTLRDDLRN